jgi:aryl-alcohol dehydrogenase-like predicted oxidoreductase
LIGYFWELSPIPGTSKVAHPEENVASADIQLSDEEFAILDREGRSETAPNLRPA